MWVVRHTYIRGKQPSKPCTLKLEICMTSSWKERILNIILIRSSLQRGQVTLRWLAEILPKFQTYSIKEHCYKPTNNINFQLQYCFIDDQLSDLRILLTAWLSNSAIFSGVSEPKKYILMTWSVLPVAKNIPPVKIKQ